VKVAAVHGPDDLRLDEVAEPVCGDDDVVVRVAACGICGSDLGYVAAGGLGGPMPMPLGHEIAGVVARMGSAVRDVAPGATVIVNPMAAGNNIGNGGGEGGLAPLVLVRNHARAPGVLAIPASVPLARAALAEPLAVALHAVNRAAPAPGERVVVLGAGAIGLGVVYWLRRRGIDDVVVADLAPRRRELALRLGARAALDPAAQPLAAALGELHGRGSVFGWPVVGSDVYVDTAGAPALIGDVVAMARAGARLVVVAVHHHPVPVDFRSLLAKELTITAAIGYPTELPEVVAMLAAGDPTVDALVTHEVAWPDVAGAFATARDTSAAVKVILRMPDVPRA
jgi:2-desacetyl-2-hydroxyethyl bacteriochlorophyllide A dehydrogenase